jgi:aspartate carbamoyltransferase catalytic subunit
LRAVARELDVLYITRSRTARFEHAVRFDAEEGHFALDASVLADLPAHARVLHPLPRGPELPPELDQDDRIACFRQAGNGLYVRMALLQQLVHAAGRVGMGIRAP